jgi:hypothetical protein
MRNTKAFVSAVAALALLGSAQAASVHLKGKTGIKLTDRVGTLQACGSLAGLGNCDITTTLTADATIDTSLRNPAGNVAPGQSGEQVVLGYTTIPSTEIKNGNVSFCVSTDPTRTPTWQEAGAPNKNWTVIVEDISFSNAELTVEQCGKVVYQQTF